MFTRDSYEPKWSTGPNECSTRLGRRGDLGQPPGPTPVRPTTSVTVDTSIFHFGSVVADTPARFETDNEVSRILAVRSCDS